MSTSLIRVSILTCVALWATPALTHADPSIPQENPTGKLIGYAVDRNGNPAGGALIQIAFLRSNESALRLRADRTGYFEAELAEGRYSVRAGVNVFPSATRTISIAAGQSMRLRLVLDEELVPATGTLYAKLIDVSGNALPQIRGHIYSAETGNPVSRFISDDVGVVKLELKPGIYYMETFSEDFDAAWTTVEIKAGNVTEAGLVLLDSSPEQTGVFVGYLMTFDGTPTPNVTGFIFSNDTGQPVARFVTEESGMVRLQLAPGKYHLKTIKNEYPSGSIEFEIIMDRVTESRIVLM